MRFQRQLSFAALVAALLPLTIWTWNASAEPPAEPVHSPEAFRPTPRQQEALETLQRIEAEREHRLREVRELEENAARIREQLMRERTAEHAPPRGEGPRPEEIVEQLHLMRNEIRQLREEVHALRERLGGKEQSQAKSPFETHAAELTAQREKIARAAAEQRKQIELERLKIMESIQKQKENLEPQKTPSIESLLKQKQLELEKTLDRGSAASKIQLELERQLQRDSLQKQKDSLELRKKEVESLNRDPTLEFEKTPSKKSLQKPELDEFAPKKLQIDSTIEREKTGPEKPLEQPTETPEIKE